MTLTLDLPSELEQYLLQEAQEQGVSIEAMTLRLLANSIPTRQKPAEILPGKQQRVFGQYQGRISMSEDFAETLPESVMSGEPTRILEIPAMKQTIKQIKIGEVSAAIQRMGIGQNTMINITVETIEDDLLTVFDRIGAEAQTKGLTEEILEELLAGENSGLAEYSLSGLLEELDKEQSI
jgi:hypothetical protein